MSLNKCLEIIGNEATISAVCSMTSDGRIPQSIVIYGEKGLGKKKLAQFIAERLLCTGENAPCRSCHACKMLAGGGHPDFIKVQPSLKSGGYKLDEDLRKVVSDAYIAPSEGRVKVYLIADMDKTPQGSQNALLKLIEEPPAHAVIILTASAREYFLPTVLSRVTALAMKSVTTEQATEYLKKATDKTDEEILDAVKAMGGNIGRCIEFFESKPLKKAVAITVEMTKAIEQKNEYDMLKAMHKCDGSRELTVTVLGLLMQVVRDSAMIRMGCGDILLGCSEESAKILGATLSEGKLSALCEICEKYIAAINGNSNLTLCLNAVCADIRLSI